MDGAQGTIEAFAEHMALAMDILAADVASSYSKRVDGMREEHSAANAARRRKIEMALLDHNDEVVLLLDTLRTLREGYRAIPRAHAQLRQKLDDEETFLTAVRRLYYDARRLKRLQKELAGEESS